MSVYLKIFVVVAILGLIAGLLPSSVAKPAKPVRFARGQAQIKAILVAELVLAILGLGSAYLINHWPPWD